MRRSGRKSKQSLTGDKMLKRNEAGAHSSLICRLSDTRRAGQERQATVDGKTKSMKAQHA